MTDQPDLLDLLASVPITHTGDPDTSRDAAEALGEHRWTLCLAILQAVAPGPLTVDGIQNAMGDADTYRVRRRVSDCHRCGWVMDSGRRKPGRSGRLQVVWAITENGRDHLQEVTP